MTFDIHFCDCPVCLGKGFHDFSGGDASNTTAAAVSSTKPVFTESQIITQLTTSWGGGFTDTLTWNKTNISYSLPDSTPTNVPGFAPTEGGTHLVSMTAPEKSFARMAFELWDDLIAPTMTESVGNPASDITFNYSNATSSNGTYTYAWWEATVGSDHKLAAGQVWIWSSWSTNQSSAIVPESYGLITYVHEIGHALGLSHPGTYDASQGAVTYATDAVYAQDNREHTVMSYFGGYNPSTASWAQDGTYSNWYYPATPMVDDIAGIQAKYGADYTTRADNTVYGFHSSLSAGNPEKAIYDFSLNLHPIYSIWDGGGIDTLDCSGYGGSQIIDLAPGNYSSVDGLNGNIGIAFNCIIENAVGGSSADIITGNVADNVLSAGAGDDTLYGGAGNDTLDGGAGIDKLVGGMGNDVYYVDQLGDVTIENLNEGNDTVLATVGYTLSANIETLYTLAGSGGTGNELDNVIYGGYAPSGLTIDGQAGNDTVYGSVFNDLLIGGPGSDAIFGLGGNDTMAGGLGDDAYFVDQVGDLIQENSNEGTDTVYATINFTLPTNVEALFPYGGATGATGNGADNVLVGVYANGSVTIDGGAGNDTLYGSNFDDILIGGSDNDYLSGLGGNDTIRGGLGNDTYIVEQVGDLVLENTNEGNDTIYSSVNYTLPSNVENVFIYGSATAATGNSADNLIVGVYTTADATLDGASGNDVIIGGPGNDTIIGGKGVDQLIGGTGNDIFLFHLGEVQGDVIVDFTGNGPVVGDVLEFVGFGPAIWTQTDPTHIEIAYTSNFASVHEMLTFASATTVHSTDILFV